MSQFFNKYSTKNFANPNIFDKSSNAGFGKADRNENTTSLPPTAPPSQVSSGEGDGQANANGPPVDKSENPSNGGSDAQNASEVEGESGSDKLFKHPLQNTWTLWYLENDRTKSWEDMQNEITSFDTVEDFWSLYNHIKPPSELKSISDYSLFKKGIRPMWEDPANRQGGRWIINLTKASKIELDTMWLDVLLCLIGEAFDNSEEICGAVVNNRGKVNKISIWTANGRNEEAVLEIGHKLREALHLGRTSLQYQLHNDTMKQGSTVKSIYNL